MHGAGPFQISFLLLESSCLCCKSIFSLWPHMPGFSHGRLSALAFSGLWLEATRLQRGDLRLFFCVWQSRLLHPPVILAAPGEARLSQTRVRLWMESWAMSYVVKLRLSAETPSGILGSRWEAWIAPLFLTCSFTPPVSLPLGTCLREGALWAAHSFIYVFTISTCDGQDVHI